MTTSMIQRSFAGGEIAPSLAARADQVKYATGLRTCRNFVVRKHGGVSNRRGFEYICPSYDASRKSRLLKFVFNAEQTYVLEFSHKVMRVIRNGVLLTSGGSIYQISTPYSEDDLDGLQYVQSGDVVTIVHPNHPPHELRRTGHTNWTLAPISFAPSIDRPQNLDASGGPSPSGPGKRYRWKVTAVREETFEESLTAYAPAKTITNATQTNPVVITCNSHGYFTGDEVLIEGVEGMEELNGRTFKITVSDSNTFSLNGEDGTGHTAYTSGGTSKRTSATLNLQSAGPTTTDPVTITWDAVDGAREYNIYREKNGVWGFIGTAGETTFDDNGIEPDISLTAPIEFNPFDDTGKYPSTVAYFQQRQAFAATSNEPEKVWMSRTGDFHNFTTRSPLQDDDAVTFTIAGRQVNEVRHLLELGRLLVLTSGGEWVINGDSDGVIRPTAINLRQHGYSGSSRLTPIVIGDSALFVQARQSVVRDLRYHLEVDGYAGSDLTVFATHLFDGHTIKSWDYQQTPDSVVWAVRDDGILLGMTYVREHEIWGWHWHDTGTDRGDLFEDVVVVPEGGEDVLYAVVKRSRRGIERMATRHITKDFSGYDTSIPEVRRLVERLKARRPERMVHMDAALTYDGVNTNPSMSASLLNNWGSGDPANWPTGGWTPDDTLIFGIVNDPPGAYFTAGDVGRKFRLWWADDEVTVTVTEYAAYDFGAMGPVHVVKAKPDSEVPESLRNTPTLEWARLADTFSGLNHLNNRDVVILADGVPSTGKVTGGAISIDAPASIVHVGLPIQSDFETLDLDLPGGETLSDKRKIVNKVMLMVEESRGFKAGEDADHLTVRAIDGKPTDLFTGKVDVVISSTWNNNGRIFVRQDDPLPLNILAAIPVVTVGGRQ